MTRRARMIGVGGALVAAFALLPVVAPPADASTVCIPLLAGTRCVQFLEGRPTKPGLSDGMEMTITPTELTDDGELTADISGFKPGEGLRRFNYNIFGPKRMNEYGMEFRRANGKGEFHWVVSPSTAVYKRAWGKPALCVYGQRSKRLACAYFTVAPEAAATTTPPATPEQSGGSSSSGGGSGFEVPVAS